MWFILFSRFCCEITMHSSANLFLICVPISGVAFNRLSNSNCYAVFPVGFAINICVWYWTQTSNLIANWSVFHRLCALLVSLLNYYCGSVVADCFVLQITGVAHHMHFMHAYTFITHMHTHMYHWTNITAQTCMYRMHEHASHTSHTSVHTSHS